MLLLLSLPAAAQTWPSKPLRVIVPIGAGSSVDLVARVVCEQVSRQLGQPAVVENRPGAGQTIGAGAVAKSEPDGYTLLVNSSAHTIAPALHPNLNYDPIRDFVAVAPLGVTPFVLVTPPGRKFSDVAHLISSAKERPGTFNFASPGVGTGSHLSAERFRLSAGVDAVHVPFKGAVEAMTEVMAGRIDFFFVVLGPALPFIREGKLAALAVNGGQRSAALPDVPTLAEAGLKNAENPTWFGLFLPARTPPEIVEKVRRETDKALAEPNVREKLAMLGVDPLIMPPEAFGSFIAQEVSADAGLVKTIGLKAE
jgi:tripartite-type tricarboxylate transporter receptor subunit TctC